MFCYSFFYFSSWQSVWGTDKYFWMSEICQLNDENCSCSDNGIIFTDNYQDNAKKGVIKRYIEMRFITIANFLFYDVWEVFMLELHCGTLCCVTNSPIYYIVLDNKAHCMKYKVCFIASLFGLMKHYLWFRIVLHGDLDIYE